MEPIKKYEDWLAKVDDEAMRADLESIRGNEHEIFERFYRDLEFGTGGLRGVLGAGTNRMNIYVVRRTTQGLANYLNATNLPKVAAIAHDSRINSDLFSREAAAVLAANGIKVWLYPRLEPVPLLSWATRYHHCGLGICITASHNPSKYNGYKVYGPDGCQIGLEIADAILSEIGKVDIFDGIQYKTFDEGLAAGTIEFISEKCLDDYMDALYDRHVGDGSGIDKLKLVYTPLNGSGLECVKRLADRLGIKNMTIVPEQEHPDGNFPTCPYPNPEIREAMQKGLELCDVVKPDILIGTDPDCDRCGTAVPDGKGGYYLISGNEMGVILLDFICKMRIQNGTMPKDPVAVTTIVSTDMVNAVAKKYGVEMRRVLTGFKFIGEQIAELESAGEVERFIFGFEESYGYLSGPHVRDKDGVNACLLIFEAAAWYAKQGKTLLDALKDLYNEFGFYDISLLSFTFEGAEGMQKISGLMDGLRKNPPAVIGGLKVEKILDYSNGIDGLPKANVLIYELDGGSKFIARPSGTEPKIKAYMSAKAPTVEGAKEITLALQNSAREIMS